MSYDRTYEDFALEVQSVKDGEELAAFARMGDGVNYSRAIGWQSPEGNFYGQKRVVRDYEVRVVWDGVNYWPCDVPKAYVGSVSALPERSTYFGEFWCVANGTIVTDVDTTTGGYWNGPWDVYYYSTTSEKWEKVEWLWTVGNFRDVPYPGVRVGGGHVVLFHNVTMMWEGTKWVKAHKHSTIENDEQDIHLPEGFITNYESYQTNTNGAIQFLQSQQAEARLEFLSKTNLGLVSSVSGKTGALWVNSELLLTDNISNVENTDSALQYSNGTITTDTVDPNTEYYVYCGNSDFSACSSGLFLSNTPDINGRLGDEEPGLNARIVGIVETDSAGYFIREIDMSYIGKRVEFSQTYWEYSDYQLQFVDQDNLAFNRIDGTHGLFYVNGQLLYLGTGRDLSREAYRIEWNDGPDVDTSDISAETTYQIYIANDSVEFNFNNEDSETGLPYEEGHESYISALDFRRQLFLSTQPHDHRVFNQEYPGYYARHIGQVQTDETGYFKYAADISLIRQPTLNPTHLDGLAECVIQDVSTTQFKVIRKKGTTGVVYVGGKPIQTFDSDHPSVHVVTTDYPLYEYDETDIDEPLTDSGITVAEKPGISVYLYLANDIDAWQGVTTFCSLEEPHGGYLSTNWPGNQARWLATIQLAPATLGSEKVTNGSFATDTAWTKGTGWSYVSADQNMDHAPGNTATLSQNVSAVAGELYACTVFVSGRTEGTVALRVGGVLAQSIGANTSSTQYLLATTTGNLEVVPDTYFDGAVDNVSVKKVSSGQFSGTYVKDSVGGVSAQIDDSIISTSTTYSSNKIEQIRQQLLAKIALALGLNESHNAGLDLVLEYINSSTIRLRALSADVDVVFPNLEKITITTAGITKTISGSVSTFYYVYLVTDGTISILTSPPTDVYSNIQFYGETYALVGYLGLSASNTISGTHNVYSFWNEPQRTYTQSTTSITSTTLSLSGLVVPPSKTATVTWTGSVTGQTCRFIRRNCLYNVMDGSYYFSDYDHNLCSSVTQNSLGSASYTTSHSLWCYREYGSGNETETVTRNQTLSLSQTSFGTGVHSVSAQLLGSSSSSTSIPPYNPGSPTYDTCGCLIKQNYVSSDSFTAVSGTITLTRPGS